MMVQPTQRCPVFDAEHWKNMKQKYEHIQLLRALACIGVFITHLAPRLGATGKAAWLANQGAAGVYLFFALSGYLACCDRKLPTAGKKELLTYYKKTSGADSSAVLWGDPL